MITKDSYEKVGAAFGDVWRSTLQLPYKAIILIDDSNGDATRNFVKNFADEHGKELIVERSRLYGSPKPTRATARQTAIDIFFENFDDRWLMFLDDDFILSPGYWPEASRYMEEPNVGLIWGIDYTPYWEDRLRWIKVRGLSEKEYAIHNFSVRGGLHDTLLRREAIEGIKIPPWLHVYEDAYVKVYVECRGWQWRIVEDSGVHLRASGEGYTSRDIDIMIKAAALLKLENVGIFKLIKTAVALPGYMFYSWKAGGSPLGGLRTWHSRLSFRARLWWQQLRVRKSRCEVLKDLNAGASK